MSSVSLIAALCLLTAVHASGSSPAVQVRYATISTAFPSTILTDKSNGGLWRLLVGLPSNYTAPSPGNYETILYLVWRGFSSSSSRTPAGVLSFYPLTVAFDESFANWTHRTATDRWTGGDSSTDTTRVASYSLQLTDTVLPTLSLTISSGKLLKDVQAARTGGAFYGWLVVFVPDSVNGFLGWDKPSDCVSTCFTIASDHGVIVTARPSSAPTSVPTTSAPTYGAGDPTPEPTVAPTTATPTLKPTRQPTLGPTQGPTGSPTTSEPTVASPTGRPTRPPTKAPTSPTADPTAAPTLVSAPRTRSPLLLTTQTVSVVLTYFDKTTISASFAVLGNQGLSMDVRTLESADVAIAAPQCPSVSTVPGKFELAFEIDRASADLADVPVGLVLTFNSTAFQSAARQIRSCSSSTWQLTEKVCIDSNSTGAGYASTSSTTSTLSTTICGAGVYAVFFPASDITCSAGKYGCKCTKSSPWIDDPGYLAVFSIGCLVLALATVLQLWWCPSGLAEYRRHFPVATSAGIFLGTLAYVYLVPSSELGSYSATGTWGTSCLVVAVIATLTAAFYSFGQRFLPDLKIHIVLVCWDVVLMALFYAESKNYASGSGAGLAVGAGAIAAVCAAFTKVKTLYAYGAYSSDGRVASHVDTKRRAFLFHAFFQILALGGRAYYQLQWPCGNEPVVQ
jgi:hypothetical protein